MSFNVLMLRLTVKNEMKYIMNRTKGEEKDVDEITKLRECKCFMKRSLNKPADVKKPLPISILPEASESFFFC